MNRFLMAAFAFAAVVFAGCSDEEPGDDKGGNRDTPVSVTGSVVIDGEPVNAAAVLLTPGGGSSITGSDGEYAFYDLTPGDYEIKVYKDGCLPFNRKITLNGGKDQKLTLTLSENTGNLEINKGFIDMGSNASNNLAAFTVTNTSDGEIDWKVTKSAKWIRKIEPETGTLPANGSAAVTVTIDRSRFSAEVMDNYTSLVVSSTTAGNGSAAELLITAFGSGDGTNTDNDNSDLDYVIVDGLYVQTKNISDTYTFWNAANRLCNNSKVGGFNDWRLPTLDELAIIYENRKAIGGFDTSYGYWSRDLNSSGTYIWMDMSSGETLIYTSTASNPKCFARAVRTAEPLLPKITTLSDVTKESKTSFTIKGEVINEGAPVYSEVGFVISTTETEPTLENSESHYWTYNGTGTFSLTLTNQTPGEKVYYRFWVKASDNVIYGETYSYTLPLPYTTLNNVGLMVLNTELGFASHSDAISLCNNCREGGYSDWRLPTKDEMVMLIVNNYLPNNVSYKNYYYWTATSAKKEASYEYFYAVKSTSGSCESYGESNYHYVRAVRSIE